MDITATLKIKMNQLAYKLAHAYSKVLHHSVLNFSCHDCYCFIF